MNPDAQKLVYDLGITCYSIFEDHMEMSYEFDNHLIIAYGKDKTELFQNFYDLYKNFNSPNWPNI